MIEVLLAIGIVMIISGFVLLVCTELTGLNPLVSVAILFIGMVVGTIGVGLNADSGQGSSTQIQAPEGETAIIRIYDINENLINEWRIEK